MKRLSMENEIINRVANSKIRTIDLEDFYPEGKRVVIDIAQWLFEGIVLREKDFRKELTQKDWSEYKNCFVALSCSTDAIIPAWAYMLLSLELTPFAKKIVVGDLNTLENIIFTEILQNINLDTYKDAPVIIKGCAQKPIPQNGYVLLAQKLQPIAKSIMYGEACSSVPLFKKKIVF